MINADSLASTVKGIFGLRSLSKRTSTGQKKTKPAKLIPSSVFSMFTFTSVIQKPQATEVLENLQLEIALYRDSTVTEIKNSAPKSFSPKNQFSKKMLPMIIFWFSRQVF